MGSIAYDEEENGNAPPIYHKMRGVFERRNAAQCASHLLPYLEPNHNILDIGCGPGSITLDLARQVPQGRVVGVDIDEESINIARRLAEEQGMTNVEFLVGSAQDLGQFVSDSFDIIHSHMVLMHLENPTEVLKSMHRIARPGGIVTARDNAERIFSPPNECLQSMMATFAEVTIRNGSNGNGGRVSQVWAHEAGFSWDNIQTSAAAWEYSGAEGRKLWTSGAKGMFRDAAVKSGLCSQKDMNEYDRQLEQWEADPAGRILGLDGVIMCWK